MSGARTSFRATGASRTSPRASSMRRLLLIGHAVRSRKNRHPSGAGFRRAHFGRLQADHRNLGQCRYSAGARGGCTRAIAQDVVVAGHERSEIRFLIFLDVLACRALCPDLTHDAPVAEVIAHAGVRACVAKALDALRRETPGSSTHATGALLLAEPSSIDAGEITDKGYMTSVPSSPADMKVSQHCSRQAIPPSFHSRRRTLGAMAQMYGVSPRDLRLSTSEAILRR